MTPQDHKVDPKDLLPRYYQVYTSLLERIQSGEFPPGALIPTERHLGEQYAVSRITIIKALELLERDGYVDRQQGRGTFALQRGLRPPAKVPSPSKIAFIATSLVHPYLSSILVGIAGVSARQGCLLHVFGSIDNSQQEEACLREAMAAGVWGLVTYPCGEYQNGALYREVLARGIAIVFCDRYYPDIAGDYVVFDDRQAGYDLTSAMIARGHRRIAFVLSEEQRATSVRERLRGYRQAVEAHGLLYDEDLVWPDLPTTFFPADRRGPRSPSTEELLLQRVRSDRATALITANYDVAERLIYALHSLTLASRLQAPGELALALGSFSHKVPAHNTPFVASLAMQPGDGLGAAAAELLFSRLNGNLPAEPQCVTLPMPIIDLGHEAVLDKE